MTKVTAIVVIVVVGTGLLLSGVVIAGVGSVWRGGAGGRGGVGWCGSRSGRGSGRCCRTVVGGRITTAIFMMIVHFLNGFGRKIFLISKKRCIKYKIELEWNLERLIRCYQVLRRYLKIKQCNFTNNVEASMPCTHTESCYVLDGSSRAGGIRGQRIR